MSAMGEPQSSGSREETPYLSCIEGSSTVSKKRKRYEVSYVREVEDEGLGARKRFRENVEEAAKSSENDIDILLGELSNLSLQSKHTDISTPKSSQAPHPRSY
jgi:hypothetical protein